MKGALSLSYHFVGGIVNLNTLSKVAGAAVRGGFLLLLPFLPLRLTPFSG